MDRREGTNDTAKLPKIQRSKKSRSKGSVARAEKKQGESEGGVGGPDSQHIMAKKKVSGGDILSALSQSLWREARRRNLYLFLLNEDIVAAFVQRCIRSSLFMPWNLFLSMAWPSCFLSVVTMRTRFSCL